MRMNPVRWLGLILIMAVAIGAVARSQQTILLPAKFTNPRVNFDFQRDPPQVEKASIRLLNTDGQSNALLRVIFERRDKRISNAEGGLPLAGLDQKVVLRDDGKQGDLKAKDGVFSAIVDLDFKAQNRQRQQSAHF
jgi:hypothetical protein